MNLSKTLRLFYFWIFVWFPMIFILNGCGYNTMVSLNEAVDGAWSEVENQLQRRSDLIPNLVNTVKGYAAHEKEIFTHVADARAKLAGARTRKEKISAANELGGVLSRLLVIVERYPDLKANTTFTRMMDELSGTENRLSVARKRYNDTVRNYNTYIRKVPMNLIASLFHFEKAPYFKVPEEKKGVPEVKF